MSNDKLTPEALELKAAAATAAMFPRAIVTGLPSWSYVSGPTYVGPNSINLLFPFSLSNGILEVNLINNFTLATGLPQNMGATVNLSGTSRTANQIGPNFRAYIKNRTWNGRTISDASSISVHIPAPMTLVQQLNETFIGHMSAVPFTVTSGPPPSNFALQFQGFGVTYAFLKPLVLRARDSTGSTFYITLGSSWDANNS